MKKERKPLQKDEKGYTLMNKNNLKLLCERDELYSFPDLNDKLYLNQKGFI